MGQPGPLSVTAMTELPQGRGAVLSCVLVHGSERRGRVNKGQGGALAGRSGRQAMGAPLRGPWVSGQDVGLA